MRQAIAIAAAASLYNCCVSGGVISGTSAADFAAAYGPAYFAYLWVRRDAETTRYWPAYHYGLYIWGLWFVAIPHYVLRTRGRSGIALALGVVALVATPLVASQIGSWLYYDLPDFR